MDGPHSVYIKTYCRELYGTRTRLSMTKSSFLLYFYCTRFCSFRNFRPNEQVLRRVFTTAATPDSICFQKVRFNQPTDQRPISPCPVFLTLLPRPGLVAPPRAVSACARFHPLAPSNDAGRPVFALMVHPSGTMALAVILKQGTLNLAANSRHSPWQSWSLPSCTSVSWTTTIDTSRSNLSVPWIWTSM